MKTNQKSSTVRPSISITSVIIIVLCAGSIFLSLRRSTKVVTDPQPEHQAPIVAPKAPRVEKVEVADAGHNGEIRVRLELDLSKLAHVPARTNENNLVQASQAVQ